ncbi:MAG: isopentenyl-diphosphate delta-isomerase [Chloroflexi bacterium]|nr:isopentenyl-diphosphate delta-isomerase [Chloroflexota bacterium]
MSERFDIYDEALNYIGVKRRAAVHRDGDWHQVFHCWVIGREANGAPFVVLQKRRDYLDYPNKIDISAAGHLLAGETARDGTREIEEELGMRVAFDELIPLGRRIGIHRSGEFVDCQICHVFLYECDQPLDAYAYQTEEIAGLVRLRIDDGLRLFAGEVSQVLAPAVGLGAPQVALSKDDFIPSVDHYVEKVLILAQRYFAGEQELWI